MPENVSRKQEEYIKEKAIPETHGSFHLLFNSTIHCQGLGAKLIFMKPLMTSQYSATYASRNGVPLEVVSKVILRHQDLKTTKYISQVMTMSHPMDGHPAWEIMSFNITI
jgi:hypothetical protein